MIRIGALVSDKKKPIITIISIFWHPYEKAINDVCVYVLVTELVLCTDTAGSPLFLL